MEIIESMVNLLDEEHQSNRAFMDGIMSEYREKMNTAMQGGGPEAVAKHTARGKLLARDRINNLLDPGAPFLNLAP